MSEAAHSSTYMTRSSEEVMHPSGWALFPTRSFGLIVAVLCLVVFLPSLAVTGLCSILRVKLLQRLGLQDRESNINDSNTDGLARDNVQRFIYTG